MSILGGLLFQPETSTSVITEIVTKTTASVLTSSTNNSGQNNVATANINISDIQAGPHCSIDITTTQKVLQSPNFSGLTEDTQSDNISTAIKGALKEDIAKTNRGIQLFSSPQNAEIITKNIDEIANSISKMSLVSCLQQNTATANLNIENIKSNCPAICSNSSLALTDVNLINAYAKLCTTSINGTQELVQAAVASCISKNTQVTNAISELAKELTKNVDTETAGLDPEGLVTAAGGAASNVIGTTGEATSGVISSASTMLIVIAVVGLIVGAVFLYFFLQSPQGQQMSSNYM